MKLDKYCDDILVEELISETISYLENSEDFLTEGFFSKIKDFITVLKDLPKLLKIGGVLDKEFEKLTDEQKGEITDFVISNRLIQTNIPIQEGFMDIITAIYKDEPKKIKRNKTLKKTWVEQLTGNVKKTLNLGVNALFLSPIILMWLGWKIIKKAAPKVGTFVGWIRDKVKNWYIKKKIKPTVPTEVSTKPKTVSKQKKLKEPQKSPYQKVAFEPEGEIVKEVPKENKPKELPKEKQKELEVAEPEEEKKFEFVKKPSEEKKEKNWQKFVDMGVLDFLDSGKSLNDFDQMLFKKWQNKGDIEQPVLYVDRYDDIPQRIKEKYSKKLLESS